MALLGAGADIFQWDPGDGSDTVEGQSDIDTLLFNGSAANEAYDLSANGSRTRLTRNVGAITMDVNDVESFTLNAVGGTDTININDLRTTDVTAVTVNLAGTIGGASGDGANDTVSLHGSGQVDTIILTGSAGTLAVSGLAVAATINTIEAGDGVESSPGSATTRSMHRRLRPASACSASAARAATTPSSAVAAAICFMEATATTC